MINCQTFRATVRPGSDDINVLEHLRSCDACLDYAVSIDPDFFFRSLGGDGLVPPGGIDSFVGGVMAQVRVRQAEGSSAATRLSLNPFLRVAAAVLFVIAGTLGVYRYEEMLTPPRAAAPHEVVAKAVIQPTTTKAVIETYQSKDATIVEMPAASPADAKIVMIYDSSLPADL